MVKTVFRRVDLLFLNCWSIVCSYFVLKLWQRTCYLIHVNKCRLVETNVIMLKTKIPFYRSIFSIVDGDFDDKCGFIVCRKFTKSDDATTWKSFFTICPTGSTGLHWSSNSQKKLKPQRQTPQHLQRSFLPPVPLTDYHSFSTVSYWPWLSI